MEAKDIMQWLYSLTPLTLENTQDVLKCGNPDKQVTKVATTMFPTVKVIKQAKEWGANLLIVHEPLYFNHCDNHSTETVESEKRTLLEQSEMTVFRYHDYSHRIIPDVICKGVLDKINFEGSVEFPRFALSRITLNAPMSALEVAKMLKEKLNLNGVRVAGNLDFETKNLSFTPGCAKDDYKNIDDCIFITGEVCEWENLEYFRECAYLGKNKATVVLGHVGSEREGMNYVAKLLKERFPELEVRYFETEESFITI